jgi:23S rRNA pseudouridine1911/1915/1917 synthase
MRQAVIPGTYSAQTEYKTLETRTHPVFGVLSLVEASPKTGRLHQIRAHFEFIGFPVLNDKIYGKKDEVFIDYIDIETRNKRKMPRHSLHSSKLSFVFNTEAISQAIGLPQDLAEIWIQARPIGRPLNHLENR